MTLHRLQEPVPPALANWTSWTGISYSEDEAPAIFFGAISTQLLGVRAEIKKKGICDPAVVATMLLPIDVKLEQWRHKLPASWKYKSYTALDHTTRSNNTYDSHYDVYKDVWIASVWNNYRTSRLLLHEHIMSQILKSRDHSHNRLLETTALAMKSMVDEICHSVPFHLGIQLKRKTSSSELGGPIPGCYLLIWPLFAAGMRRTTPWEQKVWIAEKLGLIGTTMGLALALSMAGRLMRETEPSSGSEVWVMGEWYPE